MARNVYDVALSLGFMTGLDKADPLTEKSAGLFYADYTKFLSKDALKGARIGILHEGLGKDPEIDAIFCLRGGYGTPRLLDSVDFELLAANPKPFVGYSDITALHLAISRYAGFVTFHGPMLNADLLGDKQQPTESSLFSLLRGQLGAGSVLAHPVAYPLTTIEPGIACGRLLGGNLSMIAAVMGTPFELDAEGIILFIEDVNEPIYRIDRLLTHLRLAGKLAQVRGVLVGDVAGVDNV
eukprot:gene7897-10057_t